MIDFALLGLVEGLGSGHQPIALAAAWRLPPEVPASVLLGGAIIALGLWLYRLAGNDGEQSPPLKRKAAINPKAAVRMVKSNATAARDVDVTVFAPRIVPPREEIVVQVIFHTPEREAEASRRARKANPAAQTLASVPLTIQVRLGDNIRVSVECAQAMISEPIQSTAWNGRLVCLYFIMQLPDGEMIVRPKLRVFVNGIPAGNLIFEVCAMRDAPDSPALPVGGTARTFRKPFLSYASEDRVQVLKAAQLLNALKMDYFHDILSLAPGERWQQRLYKEIDACDLFLLFWSHHAQQSEWVIREAEYALARTKVTPEDRSLEIVPVLLEGPPPPKPPASLMEIHFDDPIRHIIFAEQSVTSEGPDAATLDRLRKDVKDVYLTARGKIARLKDGTALAISEGQIRRFDTMEDYRSAYADDDFWTEASGENLHFFYREAAAALHGVDEASAN